MTPDNEFNILYADPPWAYNDKNCNGAAAQQYHTLDQEALCALPVNLIAAPHSVLFLWATNPLIPEALEVIKAWGFTFKTVGFTWIKTNPKSGTPFFGLGRWTRGNKEDCLLATKGKPHKFVVNKGVFSLFEDITDTEIVRHHVMRHSAKPIDVRQRIEILLDDLPRIELFARERAKGWTSVGNEIDGRDIRDVLCDMTLDKQLELDVA